ncbi:hypothetical protein [Pollutibacter soli]|uniref:hypothetical protein n=1 Tax=Pollutibacter soli TaxID=3034157 RepID=UPI0030137443
MFLKSVLTAFILLFACTIAKAQNTTPEKFISDTLLIIKKNPAKGFHNDYILFIPKGAPKGKKLFLLVEPNNTGKLSDSIEVHTEHAIHLASKSSVGNNISTELRIPLLVPIFPRPLKDSLMYTHALDRDVMVEKSPILKRLDLQLLAMVEDARTVLASMHIQMETKFFMSGFSASGTFTNRFSFIHPDKIQALAIGGFNGELMFPVKDLRGVPLNYPIGIYDFNKLFKTKFDEASYRSIPQYIYMGKLDENDAVRYDDAYSESERRLINNYIADNVQQRYLACQRMYKEHNINATFKTWENIGHWTTGQMNLEVIKFFLAQIREWQQATGSR